MARNFVVLGEFPKGDAWQGGFHLGGAFVEGAAVPAVAFHKLPLGKDAAAFHFEGLHGDRGVAVAADDVFGDAVGGVALSRLGDSVFCDAHHEEDVGSDQTAKAGAVIDDVVVGQTLLSKNLFEVALADQRNARRPRDTCLSEGFDHLDSAIAHFSAQILGDNRE